VSEQQAAPLRPLEAIEVADRLLDDAVRDSRLDYPLPGSLVDPAQLRLAGWLVPESQRVVAVEVTMADRLVSQAETGIPRSGVAEMFDGPLAVDAGFRAAINLLPLPSGTEVELDLRAVLADGARLPLGSVRLRRQEFPAGNPGGEDALVSVVIPCFNQAHYLDEAIESVLAQTYPELELTVVDDGSEDNTFEVASRFPGVRCLRQPNRGVAAARNAGLAASRGGFAVFLDADDRLLPDALELGVKQLTAHPEAAFAAGMPRDIGRDGGVIREGVQPVIAHDHYLNLLKDCYIWSGSSVVYRRTPLEAGGGFNERLEAADDYELYLKLAREHPVICHDAVVTEYRRHGSNTTRNAALVLTSQLQVLRGQRSQVRGKRERVARRAGIRNTRTAQGEALVEFVSGAWRSREWGLVWSGVRTLARRDPLAPLRFGWRKPRARSVRFEPLGSDLAG